MKVALVALTDQGMATAQRINEGIPNTIVRDFYHHEKAEIKAQGQAFGRLGDLIPTLWQEYSVLIFVMATGIVVRQIASLLKSKASDPAVLVLDEDGKFIIPLLSGHLGGANAWAKHLASQIGAQAVITTATDVRGLVAPDEYARRYAWKVEPLAHLPIVNRLLLDQDFLKVWTSYPLDLGCSWRQDEHYHFLTADEKESANVILDAFPNPSIKEDCVYLIPPVLSVGVGCRRGISTAAVLEGITMAVERIGATLQAVAGIYSIDLKGDEVGLIEAAKRLQVLFRTFGGDELQSVIEREHLSRSEFVQNMIGVDGVCEAASLLGTRQGRLILPKIKGHGVTIAISVENSLSWASGPETLTI